MHPENGIPLFSANPESYNLKALYSILLSHRYSLQSLPSYISDASNIMLNSISLLDEPGYTRFFLLANFCTDLFERTLELPHLDLGIEFLEHFSAVQEPGTSDQLMAAMEHGCTCLQYSLAVNVGEALDDTREIVNETCRASLVSSWIPAFGDTRTKVIPTDLIRIVSRCLYLKNFAAFEQPEYVHIHIFFISIDITFGVMEWNSWIDKILMVRHYQRNVSVLMFKFDKV